MCRVGGGSWVWGVVAASDRPVFRGAGTSKALLFAGFSGCDLGIGRGWGWSLGGLGGWEGAGVANVDDLGRPTDRPDEVVDSEVDVGGGGGEVSAGTDRVGGVTSFGLTLLDPTIRVVGPEAVLDETGGIAAFDFAVVVVVVPFLIVLSGEPRPSSREKSRLS